MPWARGTPLGWLGATSGWTGATAATGCSGGSATILNNLATILAGRVIIPPIPPTAGESLPRMAPLRGSRRAFLAERESPRGVFLVTCYRFLPIFYSILEYSSHGRVLLHDYFSNMTTVFFSDDVLQRNRYIRSEELFELSPILLLPRCLEAC